MKKATPHDRLFKELLTEFFFEFIQLFAPRRAAEIQSAELVEVDKELFGSSDEADSNQADIVVRAQKLDGDSYFLIHVENQSSRDKDMGDRMQNYFMRLRVKYGLKVFPILLCSYLSPTDPEPSSYSEGFEDFEVFTLNYLVVQLNQLDWQDFVNQPNPIASALMSRMKIARADRPKVKLACIKMILGLDLTWEQKRQLGRFVNTYLDLRGAQQREFEENVNRELPSPERSKNMDEILDELMTPTEKRGFKRGLREGQKEGRQEGRQEGEIAFLLNQLTYKVGPLNQDIENRIVKLNEAERLALGRAVFDFTGPQDLTNWLDQNKPTPKRTSK